MRGWLRNGLGALVLSSAIACAGGPSEESGASGADLTQAEATSALEALIAHPETNLRGVGDAVSTLTGASETWTLYPFQQKTTAANAKDVAADSVSTFIVVGSSGALFLMDLETGACAGAAPSGVDLGAAGQRLHADVLARDTASTQMLKTAAFPGGALFEAAGARVFDLLGAAGEKIADSGIVKSVVSASKELGAKVVGYFASSADGKAAETTTGGATNAVVKVTESGASDVGKAVVKLGDTADGKVEVKVVKTEPGTAVALGRSTDLQVLSAKTTGAVAVTVEDGVKLIGSRANSTWTAESNIVDLVGLWKNEKTGATFLVDVSRTPAELKAIRDAGFSEVWMLPGEAVDALAKGTSQLAIGSGDAIVASRADGAARALAQSANNFVVKGWDESVLTMSDADFLKTPIAKTLDAVASRALVSVKNLPAVTILGETKVSDSLLSRTIARFVPLLKAMGVAASAATLRSTVVGLTVPSGDGGVGGGATVVPAKEDPTPSKALSAGDDSASPGAAPDETADAPLAHKASSGGGCSSAPSTSTGSMGGLALGLAMVLVARRRRR